MSGVEIRVRSNSRQARNDLNKLENSVKNIELRTAAAGKAFRNLAIGIGAAFSGGVAVKGINKAADSLTNLENRIALVTGRGKELDGTMNRLFQISKKTRGDIEGSADTFNRFGIALKGTGKSSEDLLKAVTSVNKAVAISGSSAESARGALVQLGQGLAAGQLRGEELNSVLEAAPRLAQAIADEMEVPLGAIRAIAQEGKLTTELVFNALINQAEALDAEFKTMQGTSEQAFGVMTDQISRVVAEISKGLGVTAAFTDRFNQISDSLEANREAIVSGVVDSFKAVGSLFSGIKTIATGIISVVAQVIDYIKELTSFEGTKLNLFDSQSFSIAEKGLANIIGFFTAIRLDASIVKSALDVVAKFFEKTFITIGSYKADALKSVAKFSKIASDNFKDLYSRAIRFSLIKYADFRGGKGLVKDYINYLKLLKVQRQVEATASRMFKTTADFAKKYLSQAWNSVKTFLNLIERKFYWVYNEVIQNSWWTDTMEQTYFLAEKWLGKASNAVSGFGDTIKQKFKGVFESFKEGASAFGQELTISNVKIKFASLKDSLSGFASGFKESATSGLKSAMDGLSQLSPVVSASFGAALVAGVTRFLSPELFKKTFGKIGPAAIAVLFAGLATDLANILKDAGIFKQLGANLGTTLAIAFNAVVDAIPVLLNGLVEGLGAAGRAFANQLEGSILGLPAKILSFLPGGGILTAILYGAGGLAVFSSSFRKSLGGLISGVVGRSSKLTSGAGMLSSIFFGENFAAKNAQSQKIMKSSVALADAGAKKSLVRQTASAGEAIQGVANRARVAHVGIMGAFAAGSVALFGDLVGADVAAVAGGVLGNIVAQAVLVEGGLAKVGLRFKGLTTFIGVQSAKIVPMIGGSFKLASVKATAAMSRISISSKVTSEAHSRNFIKSNSLVGASFTKMGKFAKLGLAAVVLSVVGAGAAFAGTGDAAEGAGLGFLSVAGTIASLALFVPNLGGKLKALGGLFKGVGKSAKGFAVGAQMASSVAGGGVSSAALSATATGVSSGIGAAMAPKVLGKKLIDGFKGAFSKLGRVLKKLSLRVLGKALFTAIRTAITSAFVGLGSLMTAPFLAAAAAIAAIGGVAYLAIFGVEETFLAKVKKTMGKVARFFNLTNDNTVASGESAQATGRKLGSRGNLSDKLVKTLEEISFSNLNDSQAFEVSDSLNQLEKLSDKANTERRQFGVTSSKTQQKLVDAQNRATEAIIEGNRKSDNKDGDNQDVAVGVFTDVVEADLRGLLRRVFDNLVSPAADKTEATARDTEIKTLVEGLASEGFGSEDFATVKILENVLSTGIEKATDGVLERVVKNTLDIAIPGLGLLVDLHTFKLSDDDKNLFEDAVNAISSTLNTDKDGNITEFGPGVDPQLVNALFAFLASQKSGGSKRSQDEDRKALEDTLGNQNNEIFRRTTDLVNSLSTLALSANGFNDNLTILSKVTRSEARNLAEAQQKVMITEGQLQKAQEKRAAAGTRGEAVIADLQVQFALGALLDLKKALGDATTEAMLSAVDSLPASKFATALEKIGIDTTMSNIISQGIEDGVKNSSFDLPEGSPKYEILGPIPLDEDFLALSFENQSGRIQGLIEQAKEYQRVINGQENLSQQESSLFSQQELSDAVKGLRDVKLTITDIGSLMDQLNVEQSEVSGLLNIGAGFSTIKNLDMDKLFELGPHTAQNVAQLAAAMLVLREASVNNDTAESIGLSGEEIAAKIAEVQGLLNDAFKGAARTSKGNNETMFEKFVGGLNDSGFSIDIEQAAGLAGDAINSLQAPLKAIKAAQERIKKASLGDNKSRTDSLAIIEKQREAIASIFTSGTVGQANIGLEGLGIDPSQATSAASLNSLMRISSLQDDLNETLFTDFDTRKKITDEILNQQRVLEGITTDAEQSTAAVTSSIKESFSGVLKGTMSLKEGIFGVLDTISSTIIDTVVDSFVEAFMQASGLKKMFDGLFSNLFSGGDDLGEQAGNAIFKGKKKDKKKDKEPTIKLDGEEAVSGIGGVFEGAEGWMSGIFGENGAISGIFSGFSEGLGGIFQGLGGMLGGMGGGGSGLLGALGGMGGGGGLFSSIFGGTFGGFLGFSQGGTVPNTTTSQAGKDSVPTMLMPGEVVLSKNAVRNQGLNSSQQQQVYNINVSGDVSRQTRKEIVRMIPQITSGVNMTNKEKGAR